MKKLITIIVLLSISLLYSKILTLEQCKVLALKNNLNHLNSLYKLEIEQKSTENSFYNLLPSARLSASYSLMTPEIETPAGNTEDNTSLGLTLTQPLYQGGALYNSYKMQQNTTESARISGQKSKQDLLKDVEEKFFQVQLNKKLWQISTESLNSATQNLEAAEKRFKGGIISQIDYLKIKTNYNESEVAWITRKQIYQTSLAGFFNLLKVKQDFELEEAELPFQSDLVKKLTSLTPEKLNELEQVLTGQKDQDNLDLKMSKLNIKNLELAKETIYGNFFPKVNLSWSQEYGGTNLDDEFERSGALTLSASLDLFPFQNKSNDLDKAKISVKIQENLYEIQSDQLNLNIVNQLYTLIAAASRINSSESSLDVAKQSYSKTEKAFKAGSATTLELLNSKISLDQAKNNFEESRFNYHQAKLELVNLTGMENLSQLETILQR